MALRPLSSALHNTPTAYQSDASYDSCMATKGLRPTSMALQGAHPPPRAMCYKMSCKATTSLDMIRAVLHDTLAPPKAMHFKESCGAAKGIRPKVLGIACHAHSTRGDAFWRVVRGN